jgi:hypothetical protein
MSFEKRRSEINERAQRLAFSFYLRKGWVPQELTEIIHATSSLQAFFKYDPDQERVPAGSPDGGEWSPGEGDKHPGGGGNMDVDKAVKKLNDQAKKNSTGKCAKYVRQAIQAGGVKLTPPYPSVAKDYGPYLEKYGFDPVSPTPAPNYEPEKGDIAVIQPYQGGNSAGHIEMYNGSQWVSDFFQNGPDIWPGSGYRQNTPSYEIYRQ